MIKEFKENLEEIIEDSECSVEEAISLMVEWDLRELFEMDSHDQTNIDTLVIKHEDKFYEVSIQSDGCIEATGEHTILDWNHTVKELVDYVEPPRLIYDTVTVYKIDSYNLEQFILDVYDHRIELMADQEWDCNCWYDLSAKANVDMYEWEVKELNAWIETGRSEFGIIHLIMNDLATKGLIKEGDYQCMIEH